VAVFKENASGADNGRPERAKVLALARAHKIDANAGGQPECLREFSHHSGVWSDHLRCCGNRVGKLAIT